MEAARNSPPGRREFASVSESIAAARELVRDSLADAMIADSKLADIQLAVSELVTNAVVYGNGDPIAVGITATPRAIECSVASGASGQRLPDPATWTSPTSGPTGRGLAIVRAVADGVAVEIDDSVLTVRCTFDRA